MVQRPSDTAVEMGSGPITSCSAWISNPNTLILLSDDLPSGLVPEWMQFLFCFYFVVVAAVVGVVAAFFFGEEGGGRSYYWKLK